MIFENIILEIKIIVTFKVLKVSIFWHCIFISSYFGNWLYQSVEEFVKEKNDFSDILDKKGEKDVEKHLRFVEDKKCSSLSLFLLQGLIETLKIVFKCYLLRHVSSLKYL